MGPKAHILQTPEGMPIDWMLPDTTDVLPDEIYCLQIRLEPVRPADKYKLINTWVVRGLALKLVENQSGTMTPVYSRIGYFELSQKHNGFLYPDLAFIQKFQSADQEGLKNNFLRRWPNVDPYSFFGEVSDQEFIII